MRSRDHAEALWAGLLNGYIDMITTDHAPHTFEEKGCDRNGKMTKPPSFEINAGDSVAVKESSRGSTYFKEAVIWAKTQTRPGWLETDPEAFTARILALPTRDQIEAQLNTQLIVEHYSR